MSITSRTDSVLSEPALTIEQRVCALADELIARRSVSPHDEGCQQVLAERLSRLGFHNEFMFFTDTHNLWSVKGEQGPLFVFAGHTDVVPSGPVDKWLSDPFTPTYRDGFLFGRGAADMKGALAAMIIATENFCAAHPQAAQRIGFLITSDEEDKWINGTVKVIETLQARGEKIDWCVIGEPSSTEVVGDVIKCGRRGSLTAQMHVHGQQGHVAYPHLAKNAITASLPALSELSTLPWDQGNQHFPPSNLELTRVKAGQANNVVPGELFVEFNMRYSTEQTAAGIKEKVQQVCHRHGLELGQNLDIDWQLSGEPFLTEQGELLNTTRAVIKEICGIDCEANTKGGTSDGRFIAKTGAQVLELGVCNATIHQVNECVRVADLVQLVNVYERLLERMCLPVMA